MCDNSNDEAKHKLTVLLPKVIKGQHEIFQVEQILSFANVPEKRTAMNAAG